jgi:hypothetical protein
VYAGNLFACEPGVMRAIVYDDVAAAHAGLDRALDGWPEALSMPHYQVELARVMALCYAGDGAAAQQQVAALEPKLGPLLITHMPFLLGEVHYYAARASLLAGDLRDAARRARRIRALRYELADGQVALIEAALAHRRGDRVGTVATLERAIVVCGGEVGARHLAAAAHHRLAELGASDEARHRALADAWIAAEGVANPARMWRFLAPGFD